jgi:hypothetical protein
MAKRNYTGNPDEVIKVIHDNLWTEEALFMQPHCLNRTFFDVGNTTYRAG